MTADLIARLARLSTTSLIDAAPALRVLPLSIRPLRADHRVVGPIVTAEANQDLMSVIGALRVCGEGDVLVVDAGGSDRAVAGELFATEAQRRGVAGFIVHGRVRDSRTLAELSLPVYAAGLAPHAYPAVAVPRVGVDLALDGVPVRPGEWLVGDDDGLVVGSVAEFEAAVGAAEAIEARESGLQGRMLQGGSLFDVINYDEHVAALEAGQTSRLAFS